MRDHPSTLAVKRRRRLTLVQHTRSPSSPSIPPLSIIAVSAGPDVRPNESRHSHTDNCLQPYRQTNNNRLDHTPPPLPFDSRAAAGVNRRRRRRRRPPLGRPAGNQSSFYRLAYSFAIRRRRRQREIGPRLSLIQPGSPPPYRPGAPWCDAVVLCCRGQNFARIIIHARMPAITARARAICRTFPKTKWRIQIGNCRAINSPSFIRANRLLRACCMGGWWRGLVGHHVFAFSRRPPTSIGLTAPAIVRALVRRLD